MSSSGSKRKRKESGSARGERRDRAEGAQGVRGAVDEAVRGLIASAEKLARENAREKRARTERAPDGS